MGRPEGRQATRCAVAGKSKPPALAVPAQAGGAEAESRPTERAYWLIVACQPKSRETKYFLSNAPASADVEELVRAAFARVTVHGILLE